MGPLVYFLRSTRLVLRGFFAAYVSESLVMRLISVSAVEKNSTARIFQESLFFKVFITTIKTLLYSHLLNEQSPRKEVTKTTIEVTGNITQSLYIH